MWSIRPIPPSRGRSWCSAGVLSRHSIFSPRTACRPREQIRRASAVIDLCGGLFPTYVTMASAREEAVDPQGLPAALGASPPDPISAVRRYVSHLEPWLEWERTDGWL